MNDSNEIQINIIDLHLNFDHDYLQIVTGNKQRTFFPNEFLLFRRYDLFCNKSKIYSIINCK